MSTPSQRGLCSLYSSAFESTRRRRSEVMHYELNEAEMGGQNVDGRLLFEMGEGG